MPGARLLETGSELGTHIAHGRIGEPVVRLGRHHYSLTDFKLNAKEHLERLRATGRPEVLTVNGKAENSIRIRSYRGSKYFTIVCALRGGNAPAR